jgi:hypothetical protein
VSYMYLFLTNIYFLILILSKGVTDKKSAIRIGFNTLNISNVYEGEDQNMQEMKVFFGRNLYLVSFYK